MAETIRRSARQEPVPPPLPPQKVALSGNLDLVDPDGVAEGWCWSPDEPDTHRIVALVLDGVDVATAICDEVRPDLAAAGIGDGSHAFTMVLGPEHRRPGASCSLTLREIATGQQIGAAATVTWRPEPVAPQAAYAATEVTPTLQGHLDGITKDGRISGWAWYPGQPEMHVSLAIIVDDELVGVAGASGFREDLQQAGIGDGDHGFSFALPWPVLAGKSALAIAVRDDATGTPLGQPTTLSLGRVPGEEDRVAELESQIKYLRARLDTFNRSREVHEEEGGAGRLRAMRPPLSLHQAIDAMKARYPVFTLGLPAGPLATIVVPAQGSIAAIYRCLRALHAAGIDSRAEIVLIDDAGRGPSGDEVALMPSIVRNLRYLRLDEGADPSACLNELARSARTDLLIYLASDLRPEPGWLDELSDTFVREPDAALIGSRVVGADLVLRHAALVADPAGMLRSLGEWEDASLPEVNFMRAVDGVGALAYAVRRSALLEIGGLQTGFSRPGHAVLDACLRLRAAGYRVLYQPRATVVCDDGLDLAQAVPDLESDDEDTARLCRRWFDVPESALRPVRFAGHALVIDTEIPRPDRDAGSVATLEQMLLLCRLGYHVTFAAAAGSAAGDAAGEQLERLGIELVRAPHYASVSDYLAQHGDGLDLVQLYRYMNAAMFIDRVRELAPRARLIFSPADLHHLREMRHARVSGLTRGEAGAQETRDQELHCIRNADATIVTSDFELDLLQPQCGADKLRLLRWIGRPTPAPTGFAERHGIGFVGSFRHGPNADGMCWFVEQVLPLIRAQRPGLTLHIAGSDMTNTISALAGLDVVVHGWVEDLADLFGHLRLTIAPLRYGAGFKGKVATSLAHGVPVVGTTIAMEGTGLSTGQGIVIADSAHDFAAEVIRLHDDAAVWHSFAALALERCRSLYSPEAALGVYRGILKDFGLPVLAA